MSTDVLSIAVLRLAVVSGRGLGVFFYARCIDISSFRQVMRLYRQVIFDEYDTRRQRSTISSDTKFLVYQFATRGYPGFVNNRTEINTIIGFVEEFKCRNFDIIMKLFSQKRG